MGVVCLALFVDWMADRQADGRRQSMVGLFGSRWLVYGVWVSSNDRVLHSLQRSVSPARQVSVAWYGTRIVTIVETHPIPVTSTTISEPSRSFSISSPYGSTRTRAPSVQGGLTTDRNSRTHCPSCEEGRLISNRI